MRKSERSPARRPFLREGGFPCLILMATMFGPTAFAVDPLPSYIEESPLPVREAYMERVGRESLREKIEVGRERHAKRIEQKKALLQSIRNRAEARARALDEVRRHLSGEPAANILGQAPASGTRGRRFAGAIALIGFGAVVMLSLHRIMSGRWNVD